MAFALFTTAAQAAPQRATTTQAGGVQAPGSEPRPAPAEQPAEPTEPTGGPTLGGGASPDADPDAPDAPVGKARLSRSGRTAVAPVDAPPAVVAAIRWANRISSKPYRYGGGHRSFKDSAYDCSGAVSYALRGARVIRSPLDSSSFMSWGAPGRGRWITVYTNPGHAFVVIAGLRFDTGGAGGGKGPRWRREARSSRGYRARHVPGL